MTQHPLPPERDVPPTWQHDDQPRRPSTLWRFKWAIIFGLLFLAWVPLQIILVKGQVRTSPNYSMVTPGQAVFDLTEKGQYTLWVTNQHMVDGQLRTYPLDLPSSMAIKLTRQSDGAEIPLEPSINKTVTVMNQESRSIAMAQITQEGQYLLETTGSAEVRLLTFSRDFILKVVLFTLFTSCVTLLLFAAMVAAAIIALVRSGSAHTPGPVGAHG